MVRKIEHMVQVVYVMNDGAEFPWKVFRTHAQYYEFVNGIAQADMQKLGVESIRYRIMYVD